MYTVRPLSDRTRFTGKHKRSPFSASLADTEELLYREVKALGGRRLVVEVDVLEGQIRVDGLLKARAKVASPGVRVAFETVKLGPLTYATDAFTTWQDNLRAIALGLEALRKFDRYGLSHTSEQYIGFKALPAGREAAIGLPPTMTEREAATLLERIVIGDEGAARQRSIERIMTDPLTARDIIKRARRETHPDRRGDETMWREVDQAARALAPVAEATR